MNKNAEKILSEFNGLSEDEKKEVIKEIFPTACEFLIENPDIAKEIMPACMKLIKKLNLSITDIMSAMMKFRK